MRVKINKKIEDAQPVVVDAVGLPTDSAQVIPLLLNELNKLPNVMFWPITQDFQYEPFKSSHIMGFKPVKKNVKHAFGENTFTPMDVVNQEIISQVILLDYIPIEGDTIKDKEAKYNTFVLNDEAYLVKKQRCALMGIVYVGDYRLARIYEKIKEIK